MKLDQFDQLQPGLEHPDGNQESSLTELFGRSALYESHQAVDSGMPARNLTLTQLIDRNEMNKLSEHFPAGGDVIKHLQALNAQGLSGSRTLQYVSENPTERAPIFEQLVRDQAGVDRFRELMSLQLLPARGLHALTGIWVFARRKCR